MRNGRAYFKESANNDTHTYTYDAAGRPTTITNTDNGGGYATRSHETENRLTGQARGATRQCGIFSGDSRSNGIRAA
ncbi:MAG: hypothetical protein ACYDDQ_06620 [Vulcanimicrobiaceae bacterium]